MDAALANVDFWGEDLSTYEGLNEAVTDWYKKLTADPVAAVKEVLG